MRFLKDEHGEVFEEMVSIPVMIGIMAFVLFIFSVFVFASIVISMNGVYASKAADLYSSGNSIGSSFGFASTRVVSQTQLNTCSSTVCYYKVPGCNAQNPVCEVEIAKPIDVLGQTIVMTSKGVAPWQSLS